MQPDLEYSMPLASAQEQYEVQQQGVSAGRNNLLQVAELADKNQGCLSSADFETAREILSIQEPQLRIQLARWKPSPTLWHLTLILGDSTLLIALLAWIVAPPPHFGLSVSGSLLGPWNAYLVWICLTFASWVSAVNITQAQQLNCAAGLLKSPLYALCSLVLMFIFSLLLLCLFIGGEAISYIKSLLFFLSVAVPTFCVWRFLLAEAINLPRFRRQAVIVGVNAAGESIAREILRAGHPGVNVLGYIDESNDKQTRQDGIPILGGGSALRDLAQNGMIDMIIMAIDYKANPELFQEALEGAKLGASVVPVTAVYESTSGKIPVEYIGDQWSIALPAKQSVAPLYLCWHKLMDLAFGICGLVLLGLILPILALLIYLDSPGPIFFSQERAGYRGRSFRILKFRSMCTGADHVEGGAWVTRSDARVTRVGRILRATHLDELPQVINIVRGDMSLIGPRPERPEYVAELAKSGPFYTYRLSVRPGLTGWAQVKYGYGISEQDELVKLQYDLYYIKHRSFLLDVCIILKTIGEVVLCHGV